MRPQKSQVRGRLQRFASGTRLHPPERTAPALGIDRRLTLWINGGSLGGSGLGQQPPLAFKVPEVTDALADAGDPDVGRLVDLAQPLEHGDADLLAPDLRAPGPQ